MGQDTTQMPQAKCTWCGKPIVVRSLRDKGYCSRPCASMARYEKRYVGSRSGASDKPKGDRRKLD